MRLIPSSLGLVADIPAHYVVGYVLYCLRHRSMIIRASSTVKNTSPFSNSSHSFPLNDSTSPFSQRLPGSINNGLSCNCLYHARKAWAINSGPLSDRKYAGYPCWRNNRSKTSCTLCEVSRRCTSMAKHSGYIHPAPPTSSRGDYPEFDP